jgi:uncharacterized protein (TIGR02246 family)
MMKVCILLMATLALASTCMGQAAPTNQPNAPRIKPPTESAPPRGGASTRSPSVNNSLEEALITREKEVWDAIRKKDMQRFASFLAEDQLYVSDEGVRSKAESVKALGEATIPDIKLDDWKVLMIDKDAAIVTYRATATPPACGPEMASPVSRNTTVWAKRGGKWLAVFHQDTTVASGK